MQGKGVKYFSSEAAISSLEIEWGPYVDRFERNPETGNLEKVTAHKEMTPELWELLMEPKKDSPVQLKYRVPRR